MHIKPVRDITERNLTAAFIYVHIQERFCDPGFQVSTYDRGPLSEVAERIADFDRMVAKETDIPRILLLDRNREGGFDPYRIAARDMMAVLSTDSTNGFSNPALDSVLENSQIQNLKIAGVARSACVLGTALTGVSSGYNVEVIVPLTADYATSEAEADLLGTVRFHAQDLLPREARNLKSIIWRCDASDSMSGPPLRLDDELRETAMQQFPGDRIVSAFQMSSRQNAERAALSLAPISVGNTGDHECKGVDQIKISSDGDEHVMLVSMTDHPEVQRSVENLIGPAHSYVMVPHLIAA